MAYIGIDLGTTYCAAAQFIDGRVEMIPFGDKNTLPSVVSVKRGKILVGWQAKNNQAVNPQDTIVEIKRLMGENEKVKLGQKEFSPEEISAMILKEIKKQAEEYLGEDVTGAVITCPAYFKNKPREATKEAGRIAGLNVIQVLNEPTAAAHAYGHAGNSEEDGLYLVYDLGGGTFDVTVIEKSGTLLEVIGTGGDPKLGGGDFDDRIVEWIISKLKDKEDLSSVLENENTKNALFKKLKAHAEIAKKELCGPPSRPNYQFQILNVLTIDDKPVHFTEMLSMDKFNELIMDLVSEKSLKWVEVALENPKKEHNYDEDALTAILLVGGSTRVPLVREILENRFPNTPIRGTESGINPDEIVAMGASLIAAEKDPDSLEDVESDLVDVTGHSLSVVSQHPENKALILNRIIPKEKPIPVSASKRFQTQVPFQEQVQVQVYQGEHEEGEDLEKALKSGRVTRIGEFTMKIEPPSHNLIPVEIELNLDLNGILVATAKNLESGKSISCEISGVDKVSMSSAELKRRQQELNEAMKQGVGSTANPLETGESPGSSLSKPVKDETREPLEKQTTTQQGNGSNSDPKNSMNPIIRSLYQKAIDNFDKIPAEKQADAIAIVGSMEKAAKADDQATLMSYYTPLKEILSGID